MKEAFRTGVRAMPAHGTIVAALDDENVCDVLDGAPCKVIGYGVGDGEHGFRAVDLEAGPAGTAFRVLRDEHEVARAVVPLYGRHNVANALGALATAVALGVPAQEAATALARFRGVRRRQEVRGEARGVTVLDDFAHHPTAVRETIAAMRMRYPDRRLVAVLEPRSNTSRRALFQQDFADALAGADRVVVSIVPPEPIYSRDRHRHRVPRRRAHRGRPARARRRGRRDRRRPRDRRAPRRARAARRRRAGDEQRRVRRAVDEAAGAAARRA